MTQNEKYYYGFQRSIGTALCALSTLVLILTGEGTQACMFIPLGIYIIVTKSLLVDNELKQDILKERREKEAN